MLLVSINDDQRVNMELLLDEALPGMRVGSFVWRTRQGSNVGRQAFVSTDHEYALIYAKDGFHFQETKRLLKCIASMMRSEMTCIG